MTTTKKIKILEKDAYHIIDVETLQRWCNPLSVWYDDGEPITEKEVNNCLNKNSFKSFF